MADGRERPAWERAAIIAAGLTGADPMKLIPLRYRPPEPAPVPVTEGDSRRGWALLTEAMAARMGGLPVGW